MKRDLGLNSRFRAHLVALKESAKAEFKIYLVELHTMVRERRGEKRRGANSEQGELKVGSEWETFKKVLAARDDKRFKQLAYGREERI